MASIDKDILICISTYNCNNCNNAIKILLFCLPCRVKMKSCSLNTEKK